MSHTILTAHQTAYLPWLGLFHKIIISDIYIYLDNVQFGKNSFCNRNRIKTPTGTMMLTVPVKLKGHTKNRIKDIEIDNTKNWRKSHWKSIYLNYKKAKYFSKYSDFFEEVYKKDWRYLTDLNEFMLRWFLRELGVRTIFRRASDLDIKGQKSEYVLNLCKKFDASIFVFGAQGKDYAKENLFKKNQINLYFQNYSSPIYPQLFGSFERELAIIDLLFNCGDKSLIILQSGNVDKRILRERSL